ncbi:hypothetical protein FRC10_005700 [Ceratobasidium sp. 414]|nr:hypothetical protein FRC10_005700 [Ceratobasidium sp. 414]
MSSSGLHEHHGFPEEDLREGGHNNPGYFRIWLGIQLKDERYCIMRKLGWGRFSTVWLVRDFELKRYAALKIMTRAATLALGTGESDELTMLQKIVSTNRSHQGSHHLVEYYDTFEITGPEGPHRCIVAEVLGPSLNDLRRQAGLKYRLPPWVVKSGIRQILLGLDYLHTSCNIVHTNIKFNNVMFRLPDAPSAVERDTLECPSRTYDGFMKMPPAAYMVESQPIHLDLPCVEPQKLGAVVADFGHSHWLRHHFNEDIQPAGLRAPEVILGYAWNQAVDIWSIGCLVVELLVGSPLFLPVDFETDWDKDEDQLAQMIDVTEEQFPLDMLSESKHRSRYIKADGSFVHSDFPREPKWSLRRCLARGSSIESDGQEVDEAVGFLKCCLRLQPENRATAKELAEDLWLVTG